MTQIVVPDNIGSHCHPEHWAGIQVPLQEGLQGWQSMHLVPHLLMAEEAQKWEWERL